MLLQNHFLWRFRLEIRSPYQLPQSRRRLIAYLAIFIFQTWLNLRQRRQVLAALLASINGHLQHTYQLPINFTFLQILYNSVDILLQASQ